MRSWLTCGLVGFWSLAVSVAACGSDEGASSGGSPDADASDASAGDDAPPGSISVTAADVTVYTGSRAEIDASQSGATSFAWTVKTAPSGSSVTTQALGGAATARPSFVADVSGDYVLEVTARGAGGESATKSVKVKAVAAPLFFMQTNFGEDPAYFEYRTIGTDKSNNHPIACRISAPPEDGGAAGAFLFMSMLFADMGMDWWEAPPGSPSRVAYTSLEVFPDGGSGAFLALGSSDTTCANPPAVVRHIVDEDGGKPNELLVQPHFSPNGARVAYVEERAGGHAIGTVSYDGNDRRVVSRFCGPGVESCWSPAVFPPRPQWIDAQNVGWARAKQADGGAGWEVVVASDSANPMPRTHMTCDGLAPRSIAFLKGGRVVANPMAADTQTEDVVVLEPTTPGGPCRVVKNLTNLGTKRSYARDFVVSPDESEILFVRTLVPEDEPPPDAGGSRLGGELYVVPVDGSSAPKPFGGAPRYALFGARYVASASQIAWNGAVAFDGGAPEGALLDAGIPSLAVATRDGTRVTPLVVSNLDAGVYVVGGGNGGSCDFRLCSFAGGKASGGGALATAAAALALAVRRKRRRPS
ncbi:MAG: hypothetical protein KF764_31020 [Labilithrix sp.]|nr:hypothetical protein [Labilithrix sp.]MBX3222343.1 hypothetical protein [Labilithrix sp.]